MTVLHVEDDDNDAILLVKACQRAGLPVVVQRVAHAEEAKSYLRGEGPYADRLQHPMPQVMVLDLKLPSITGFELLTWLRAQPELASLPVLVFTSSLSREDKARALGQGANWYFVKPATFEALVEMVGTFGIPDPTQLN